MKRSQKLLILSCCVLAVFAVIPVVEPKAAEYVADVQKRLVEWAAGSSAPYLTAFILSVFGNTTVFIPFPYVAIVFILTSEAGLDPLLLGITSGVGAALGEVTSYAIGWGGGSYLDKHGYSKKFAPLRSFLLRRSRITPLIIYIFAATPLPDDVLLIPLGLIKYGWARCIVPAFLGKTSLLLLVGYAGSLVLSVAGSLESSPLVSFYVDLVSIALVIVAAYVVMEFDWSRLLPGGSSKAKNPA